MIVTPAGINLKFLAKFRQLILAATKAGDEFILVAGGGAVCRTYQAAGKKLKFSDAALDWLGIRATELNAEVLRQLFVDVKGIAVSGGKKPGASTDTTAVRRALAAGVKTVINISNVDYVYNADPKKNKSARILPQMSWPEFLRLVGTKWRPGMHTPFDPVAAHLAAKAKLTVKFVSGDNLLALRQALADKRFSGTTIF